jgi:L-rhamnose mutarotase
MKESYAQVNDEIEEEIKALHRKFWSKVSDKMVEGGMEKYEASTLEKEWK